MAAGAWSFVPILRQEAKNTRAATGNVSMEQRAWSRGRPHDLAISGTVLCRLFGTKDCQGDLASQTSAKLDVLMISRTRKCSFQLLRH